MMGHREKLVGGNEYEALTRFGKRYHRFKPGQRAATKRKFWKRQRAHERDMIEWETSSS